MLAGVPVGMRGRCGSEDLVGFYGKGFNLCPTFDSDGDFQSYDVVIQGHTPESILEITKELLSELEASNV